MYCLPGLLLVDVVFLAGFGICTNDLLEFAFRLIDLFYLQLTVKSSQKYSQKPVENDAVTVMYLRSIPSKLPEVVFSDSGIWSVIIENSGRGIAGTCCGAPNTCEWTGYCVS